MKPDAPVTRIVEDMTYEKEMVLLRFAVVVNVFDEFLDLCFSGRFASINTSLVGNCRIGMISGRVNCSYVEVTSTERLKTRGYGLS